MRPSTTALLVWLSACGVFACSDDSNQALPVLGFDHPLAGDEVRADGADFTLVYADEFDRGALDTSMWFARTGDLGHKSTLNAGSPSMVAVHDGSLFVSADKTPGDAAPYAAGYLETKGQFAQTYGKIELRLRAQYAPGVWYAVWGRPWKNPVPELDIELLAENVTQAWFVNHWDLPPVSSDNRRRFVTVNGMDITDYHVYSIVWLPDLVEWQIDGKPYMRVTNDDVGGRGVPHEPMFWIVNGWVGGWGGTPNPATIFPAHFEIDWIRMYRPTPWLTEPQIRIANPRDRYSIGDTIDVEIADFDAPAHVDVWEGAERVASMTKPPFRYRPNKLTLGPHALRFEATDGKRTAQVNAPATIY